MTNKNLVLICIVCALFGAGIMYWIMASGKPAPSEEIKVRAAYRDTVNDLRKEITAVINYSRDLEEQNAFLLSDTSMVKKIYVEKTDSVISLPATDKVKFSAGYLPKDTLSR